MGLPVYEYSWLTDNGVAKTRGNQPRPPGAVLVKFERIPSQSIPVATLEPTPPKAKPPRAAIQTPKNHPPGVTSARGPEELPGVLIWIGIIGWWVGIPHAADLAVFGFIWWIVRLLFKRS